MIPSTRECEPGILHITLMRVSNDPILGKGNMEIYNSFWMFAPLDLSPEIFPRKIDKRQQNFMHESLHHIYYIIVKKQI